MGKLAVVFGASIGGAIGWWLGAFGGTMVAFVASMLGTGIGIYAARRWVAAYFG